MKNYHLLIFFFFGISDGLIADQLDNYWQQKVDYDMDVTLHDSLRQITAKTVIRYTNNSPDSLDYIYMHLYPNAFQVGSVKYREYIGYAGRQSRAKYFKNRLAGFTSKIDVHSFSVALPKDGSSWIHKVPILDEYKIDDTILEAKLLEKIPPGKTARIDIDWTHHVGDMVERAGYYQGQYNMAQWYPKMVVFDEEGWHPDVFHAEGEFYGEFGNFKVKFTLPQPFIIAASGVVTDGDPGWEHVKVDTIVDFDVWLDIFDSTNVKLEKSGLTRNVTFSAENVHDFAWVASKDFLYEGGLSSDGETEVHVLYDKKRGRDWTKVVLARSIRAIDWLEEKFGNYPYPQITTTDRIKNGGMEYPMLVMNGRDSESLIVHEYGHIYFYGILANNEVDESWLDEGFTTHQTRDYMVNRYGEHGFEKDLYEGYDKFPKKYWPLESDLGSAQWSAIRFMRSGHDENISRSSYLYKNGTAYSRNAYTKPSLMLNELKYILEDSLYYAAMQHYYKKWQLKHVNEDRFIESMEETVEGQLDWFFDPWLHTTRHLDYKISFFKKSLNVSNNWDIELGIKNKGARFLPLLIETKFEDGTWERNWWTDHLWRFQDTIRYTVDKKPVSVTLDPETQTLDMDYRNNTTHLRRKILFDWPGLNYRPRNEMVYRWMPYFYYHKETTGFAPGLNIDKEYGFYEHTTIRTNYALKSKEIYWYINGWRQAVHHFPRTTLHFWGFSLPGVKEYGSKLEKEWNRVYGRTPTHTIASGFYIQPSYDSLRAAPLGYSHEGGLAVAFLDWKTYLGPININLNGASTIGPFSKWNFNRLTFTGNFKQRKKISFIKLNVRQRIISGKIWTQEKLPGQEGYNIEGNSSNDMLRKNYLVDQFYGQDKLFTHYHMPGEGNIRGFVGVGIPGGEALFSSSTEFSIYNTIPNTEIDFEFSSFMDVGTFWNTDFLDSSTKRRIFADAGLGLCINTNIFEKDFYFRVDCPLVFFYDNNMYTYQNGPTGKKFPKWIISFQKSI